MLGACAVGVGRTGAGVVAGTAGARVDAADGGACTAGVVGRAEGSGTALTVVGVLDGDWGVVVVAAAELPASGEPSDDGGDETCFSVAAAARLTVSAADAMAAIPTHPAVIRRTLRRRASPLADPAVVDRRGMRQSFRLAVLGGL